MICVESQVDIMSCQAVASDCVVTCCMQITAVFTQRGEWLFLRLVREYVRVEQTAVKYSEHVRQQPASPAWPAA